LQRILSIFLLLAFSAGTCIWGLRLSVEKRVARREARQLILQGIPQQQLQVLSFAKKDAALHLLEWKHEGEFRLEGQLYDIVGILENADSVRYTCYPDTKESQIDARIGALSKLLFGQQPFQREREQQWVSFLRGLMLPQEPWEAETVLDFFWKEGRRCQMALSQGHSRLYLPPPERV
jgi:hypothetical protein